MAAPCYIAIDLKSFYASVECVERGLDPLKVNLVVADQTRTDKTICLAVSPSLKAMGVPSRPRLFEVVQKVNEINAHRKFNAPGKKLTGASYFTQALECDPSLAVDYIVATPQMAKYIRYSARIYAIYLRYAAAEDIHVYSIDEVFINAAPYLASSGKTARELAEKIVADVLEATGITATVGIGTNLYLSKVAMDILAKKMPPDKRGVRAAELDEESYRALLWDHRPLTDFWRVGRGISTRLAQYGMYTMGDVARCSIGGPAELNNERLLYRLFGVNAELLIDHAWGWEPCTIADIKAFEPSSHCLAEGQVLSAPYSFEDGRMVARELADALSLRMVAKGVVTQKLSMSIGFDAATLHLPGCQDIPASLDHYGRSVPKQAHGTLNLPFLTSSCREIMDGAAEIYDRIVGREMLVRRIFITACDVKDESMADLEDENMQLDLFSPYQTRQIEQDKIRAYHQRQRNIQKAILSIKNQYGKDAIFKALDMMENATARERNRQIGGHRA